MEALNNRLPRLFIQQRHPVKETGNQPRIPDHGRRSSAPLYREPYSIMIKRHFDLGEIARPYHHEYKAPDLAAGGDSRTRSVTARTRARQRFDIDEEPERTPLLYP